MAGRTDYLAAGAPVRRMLLVLLLCCAVQPAIYVVRLAMPHAALFPDFFGLWSFGRYVLAHAPASIYDTPALTAYQRGLGLPAASGSYPFPYPPWVLLLLTPFGALPYAVARGAWLVLTFGAYVVALGAWRWPPVLSLLLVVAPSSAVCFLVGQNGFLSAALMLGGLRLLMVRPVLGGALLAAVAYKPQLAILLPFLLLFGRRWQAIGGALVAVVVLTLATTAVFGVAIWPAWIGSMRAQAASLTAGRSLLLDMMPTLTASVLLLGGPMIVARLVQLAGIGWGLVAVWRARGQGGAAARAVVPLATFIATPYAFHYDMPMVTGAVLAVIAARMATPDGKFGGAEFVALLACIFAPLILVLRIGSLAEVATLAVAASLWTLRPEGRAAAVTRWFPGAARWPVRRP